MADKNKVNWWDTFNPFAHSAAAKKTKVKKPKAKAKPIDWTKRVKSQEAAKKKTVEPKKARTTVVKPKKRGKM